jgi:peptide/nickel transport system substrate-binding protein
VEPFLNHPYWTNEYMGLGPYKLERWEPGAFIEASAFDRHALGAPKIQRVKLLFIPDDNGAMANLLSGEIDLFDNLPITQTAILMRQWAAGSGTVVPYSNAWTAPYFQWRPDMVNPPALHDRRVRAALAHTLDRASLNEAAFEGQAPIADSPFADNTELGRAANEGAVRYPFDPDRSAQLMAEAGFRKGADGFYVGPTGERFTPDLRGGAGSASERLTTAVASGWRQAGFDFTQSLLSAAQSQDPEAKSTYPGLLISSRSGGEGMLNSMGTPQISGPANNWRGRAWEGYSNPEMDRELNLFSAALDPADRARSAREIVRIYTSDLFSLPFFFNVSPWVFAAAVKGPMLRPASSNPTWNIHEWELR